MARDICRISRPAANMLENLFASSDEFIIAAHATFIDHRDSAPSIEYRESSGRYTDDEYCELSSVRLDQNAMWLWGRSVGLKVIA